MKTKHDVSFEKFSNILKEFVKEITPLFLDFLKIKDEKKEKEVDVSKVISKTFAKAMYFGFLPVINDEDAKDWISGNLLNYIVEYQKFDSQIELLLYSVFDYVQVLNNSGIHLKSQVKIGAYRVDFLIDEVPDGTFRSPLIVECDGHNYHSSKEQIKRDHLRDEFLILEGYSVMHLSGSEIYNEPEECVERILRRIEFLKNN